MQSIRNGLWFVVGIVASICAAEKFHEHTKLPSTNEPTVEISSCGANESVSLNPRKRKASPVAAIEVREAVKSNAEDEQTIPLLKLYEQSSTQAVNFNRLGVKLLIPSKEEMKVAGLFR